ncbi:MAG: hypothetical protein ABI614_18065 [Planctomycetota bacterium]
MSKGHAIVVGFCIDETKFVNVDDLTTVVQRLNELLSTIHNRQGQQVYKSPNLDYIEIVEGVELCSLLYNGGLRLLDQDDRMLLIAALNRCVGLDSLEFEIPDGEVSIAGESVESETVLFAIAKALSKEAIGIIHPKPVERLGPLEATVGAHSTQVFHVGLSLPLEEFYRFMISLEEVSRQDFPKWTSFAFERLRFALDPGSQIGRFKQKYEAIRDDIIKHLSAINDEFVSMLVEGEQLADVCNRIKAECGVNISTESPKTHGNASAMKEREVVFEGSRIVCEFHSKLTPTHDRIHFSPTLRKDKHERPYLVIGPFAEHLKT